MNFVPYWIVWGAMALVVILLAFYRSSLAHKEDESIHVGAVSDEEVARQAALAKKLERVDLVGKVLTVIVVLYGLALGGYFLYLAWTDSARFSG